MEAQHLHPNSVERAWAKQRTENLAQQAQIVDQGLDEDSILERLNEAAVMAHLQGEPAKEAQVLMCIAHFMGYINK